MRVAHLRIDNYKGVRSIEIDNLADDQVVAISGRNGTGKSHILEAIVTAWGGVNLQRQSEFIGSWGNVATVNLTVTMTAAEQTELAAWAAANSQQTGDFDTTVLTTEMSVSANGTRLEESPAMRAAKNPLFRRKFPFATVDFLPAARHVPIRQTTTIDPQLFGETRTQQDRTNMYNQYLNDRSMTEFPGVKSFLATQHYLDLLAKEAGVDEAGFARVSDVFFAATGKRIRVPTTDIEQGMALNVETRSGVSHDLDGLSSGEQAALALMYFTRRMSARGAILLIDEPEQHLHPALQASFLRMALDTSDRSQLIFVTHSPKLLTLVPLTSLFRVQDPADVEGNQAARSDDWPDREALFEDVGLTPLDLMQHDYVLVVEGDDDVAWLEALMPVELSRAAVVNAGGGSQVEAMRTAMEKLDHPLPWLCIRDRDFLSDDQVAKLNSKPGLIVLPRREVENLALDTGLIAACFRRAGEVVSSEAIEVRLRSIAEKLKLEALAFMIESKLAADFPLSEPADDIPKWQRAKQRHEMLAEVHASRAANYQSVSEEQRDVLDEIWENEWARLVDGKKMLKALAAQSPLSGEAKLISAIQQTCLAEPSVMPAAWTEIRDRIQALGK